MPQRAWIGAAAPGVIAPCPRRICATFILLPRGCGTLAQHVSLAARVQLELPEFGADVVGVRMVQLVEDVQGPLPGIAGSV